MTKSLSIDVLISTYGERIDNVGGILHSPKENVNYIICHQNSENNFVNPSILKRPDVKYIPSCTKGVAKSRNILLYNSTADIVYLCDDDIVLTEGFDKALFDWHSKYIDDVILLNIKDEFDNYRKNYPRVTIRKNRFNILSVGTIEISLKKNAAKPFFPEDIGAGTDLPVGDEAVFLSQLLKNGSSIRYVPYTIAIHPKESTGLIVSEVSIYSRGVTLRRVYGLLMSFPLALLFLIKRRQLFKIKEGLLRASLIFFSGVINGK